MAYEGDVDLTATLARIKAGEQLRFTNDGATFQNRERRLPENRPAITSEYVHPTPGLAGPGPQRIVVGEQGETYYTPDHIGAFGGWTSDERAARRQGTGQRRQGTGSGPETGRQPPCPFGLLSSPPSFAMTRRWWFAFLAAFAASGSCWRFWPSELRFPAGSAGTGTRWKNAWAILSWLRRRPAVAIVHEDLPFGAGGENRADILEHPPLARHARAMRLRSRLSSRDNPAFADRTFPA